MKEKINIANIVTGSRILFSVCILLCPAFTVIFYVFYLLAALSDMVDGTIARTLNQASSFGAKLDTIADLVFIMAVFWKVFFSLHVPIWLWIWIGVIALIKICNLISGYVMERRLIVEHTLMNKATGFLLFLLPLGIGLFSFKTWLVAAVLCCIVATFAAIQEGHYIRTGKEV